MLHQLSSFLCIILFTLSAQASTACNSSEITSRIYSSIGKYLCLDKFYHGASKTEKKPDSLNCSGLYLGLAVAPIASGVAAKKAAAMADTVSHNASRQRLAVAAKEARKDAEYWKRFTRANTPSFRDFSDFSRSEYKKYLTEAEALDYLTETLPPSNTFSKKVAKIASKKVVLYSAAALTGFGVLLTAADVASALFSPTQAACSTIDYMYIDTKGGCEPLPAIGPNTSRFLGLPAEEQDKLMKDYPLICDSYTQLAQKLESDLEKAFPSPEFQVTSCGKNNEVTGVDLKYPNGGGSYSVNLTGNTLAVKTAAPDRMNYDLILQGKGFGVDSVSTLRATVKDSMLARVHIPSEVLKNTDNQVRTAQRELSASLKALEGFDMVKTSVGNQCRNYLEQQSEESEATAPTNR